MPPPDTTPLLNFLRVEQGWEADALKAMKQAAAASAADIRRLQGATTISGAIRQDQLRLARQALLNEQASLWRTIGSQVQAARAEAAAAAVGTMHTYESMLLNTAFSKEQTDALLRAAQATARRNVEAVTTRIMGYSRFPLSEQVYKTAAWSNGLLERRITTSLARGMNARQLADSVRDLINPATPGGVKYAAMRLGRTEINNAYHATSVRHAQGRPWITGMKWELSGSHPTPDECDDYAESSHYTGGDPGVFKPGDVPQKPHPNCLCFVWPVTVSDEEFLDRLNSGEYDESLNRIMGDAGYPMRADGRIIDMVRGGAPTGQDPFQGAVLRARREDAGLTRPQVAKEANTTVAKLARVEIKGGTDDEVAAIHSALDRLGARIVKPPDAKVIIDDLADKLDEINAAVLRTRREAGGLSRTDVAKEANTTVAKVARIETKGGTQDEMKAISDALDRLGVSGKVPKKLDPPAPGDAVGLPGKPVKQPKELLDRTDIQYRTTGRTRLDVESGVDVPVFDIYHPVLGRIGEAYKRTTIEYLQDSRSYAYGTKRHIVWETKLDPDILKLINEERVKRGLQHWSLGSDRMAARTMGQSGKDMLRRVEDELNAFMKRNDPGAILDKAGNVYEARDVLSVKVNGKNKYEWWTNPKTGKASWTDLQTYAEVTDKDVLDALTRAQKKLIDDMTAKMAAREAKRLADRAAGTFADDVMREADDIRATYSGGGFGQNVTPTGQVGYDATTAAHDLRVVQEIGRKAAAQIDERVDDAMKAWDRAHIKPASDDIPGVRYTYDRLRRAEVERLRMEYTREYVRQARGTVIEGQAPKVEVHNGPAKKGFHQQLRAPSDPIIADFRLAMETYPEEWVDAWGLRYGINEATGRGQVTLYKGSRGYFNQYEIVVSGDDKVDLLETMFHEIGHGMESQVRGLKAAQQAWWTERSGLGTYTKPRDGGYFPHNPVNPTPRPYTLKRYSKQTDTPDNIGYEIFTTGIQEVFGSGRMIYTDDDLRTFILGVLLCL